MRLVGPSGELQDVRSRRWILSGLNQGATYAASDPLINLVGSPTSPQNFARFSDIYKSNPYVHASVNVIANSLARLPLKVYQRGARGTRVEIHRAPPGSVGRLSLGQELAALIARPTRGMSAQAWIKRIVIDKLVFGNSLVLAGNGSSAVPTELAHVNWRTVEVKTGDTVPILYYVVNGTEEPRKVFPLDAIHFGYGTDIDSPFGVSPLTGLRHTVKLHDAVTRHLVKYYENAARPSGILRLPPAAGSNEKILKQTQQIVEEMYSSPENAGRVLVTSGEWQALANDPKSAQIVELINLSREEILAVFQVPAPIIGLLQRAIQSNAAVMNHQFIRNTCGPIAAEIENDLNAQLVFDRPNLERAGFEVAFDMSAALRPDLTELATVLEKTRHALTPNEQRAMLGYEEINDPMCSVTWMPSGQVPLSSQVMQPQVKGAFEINQQAHVPSPGEPEVPTASNAPQAVPGI